MYDIKIKNNKIYVYLFQDLDHHLTTLIRDEIDSLIEKESIYDIVFDFSKVVFMDSAGIGLIMGRYKKVNAKSGSIIIEGIGPSIERILTISGLYKIINTK